MPECHKCSHDGNPTRDCLKCKGPSDNPNTHRYGHPTTSRDAYAQNPAADDAGDFFADRMLDQGAINVNTTITFNLADCCAEAVTRLLLALEAINDKDRNVLFARLNGDSVSKIGIRYGVSKQAVFQRMRKIARKYPEIRSVFAKIATSDR
jgi:hypothetical protein